ncbi:MAG: hypothetical protein EXR72_02465 [Myxococcales bacterium]|nr:hypothetical protein [Myxococcales bacterium]
MRMKPRSTRLVAAVLLAAAVPGCTPSAPAELNQVTGYLFREWDNPDRAVMRAGLDSLEKLLAAKKLGPDGAGDDRLLRLDPFRREYITVTPLPMDRDPQKTLGIAVTRESKWPVIDFARVQADKDQLAVEPSATAYARTFVEPADPACFLVDAACATLRTSNELTRSNATLKLTYTLLKDFRWFDFADGRRALVGRSWAPRSASGETGTLFQSFTVDAFLGRPGGSTWRYQATFSETELGISTTDDIQVSVIAGAIDEAFKKADRVISERYHGGM